MTISLPLVREKLAEGVYVPTAFDTAAAWCRWFIPAEIERVEEYISQAEAKAAIGLKEGELRGSWVREEIFPQMMRYTQLVLLYSKLEGGLKTVAEIYAPVVGNFPKETYIRKLKEFFDGIPGFSFPLGERWEEILNFGQLRNVIVHSEGFVRGVKKTGHLKAYIASKHPDLQIDDTGQVQISREFLKYSTSVVRQFFLDLADACLAFAEQSAVNAND